MTPTIPFPALCLVTDRTRCAGRALIDAASAAVSGGVNMVQLREKDLPASELCELGAALAGAIADRALLFVNDRVDVALACGAAGVQLGERGLPVPCVRRVAGERLLIGRSVHDAEGAVRAEAAGADVLILGAVFPTASHPGQPPGGLGLVRDVCRRVSIPVLAIGGVDPSNAAQVMGAGASGAAVISAVMESPDPARAARELLNAMQAGAPQPGARASLSAHERVPR